MPSRWLSFLIATFLLVWGSLPADAQSLVGAITGTIRDQTGLPLPGVMVEVSSASMIGGARSATTGERGAYHFLGLPPGSFVLTASLTGFKSYRQEGIIVTMSGTATQDLAMGLADVAETVTVIGETPLIDVARASLSRAYTEAEIENLPLSRNSWLDVFATSPGIVLEGPLSGATFGIQGASNIIAFGSDRYTNTFRFDGVDASDVDTGGARIQPIPGVFKEIQVMSVGAPAEFGGYLGAAVNVVSKSGGNEFSGNVDYFFQTGGLTGENAGEGTSFTRDIYHDVSGTVGGPISEDKLWFFVAYQYLKDSFSEFGGDPDFPSALRTDRVFGKITWSINQNNQLWFSFHNEFNDFPDTLTPDRTPETLSKRERHYPTPSVQWTSVLSNNTVLTAGFAGWYMHDEQVPLNGDFTESVHFDAVTGISSNAPVFWYEWDLSRTQVKGDVSHYADDFMGSHDLKFGAQFNRGYSNARVALTGGGYYYDLAGEEYLAFFQRPHHYGGVNRSTGVFVDDAWSPNERLSVNLGLRLDHEVADVLGNPELDDDANEIGFIEGIDRAAVWTNLSPRVGLVYQLTADHKTALKASYGRYVDNLKVSHLEGSAPTIAPLFINGFNPDTGEYDIIFQVVDPVSNTAISPDLRAPRANAFSVAFEREILPNMAVSVTGVYKRTSNIISFWNDTGVYEPQTIRDEVGNTDIQVFNQINPIDEDLYVVTNIDEYKQKYRGVVLEVKKRPSDNWYLTSSLTISRSDGLGATSRTRQGNTALPGADEFRDPNMLVNNEGPLQGDRTYLFKLFGGYEFPYGIRAAVNLTAQTGIPFARTLVLTEVSQPSLSILTEPRGSLRLPSQALLDIRLEKVFNLGSDVRFAVRGDFFNLFNEDVALDVISSVGDSENFLVPSSIFRPRRVQIGLRLEF